MRKNRTLKITNYVNSPLKYQAMQTVLPPVLNSLKHLEDNLPEEKKKAILPIDPVGATFSMAQELTWLDLDHFAVGRWDGSMSIFKFTETKDKGPLITEVINTPSAEGVQMITWIAPAVFATSNDDQSVLIWKGASPDWTHVNKVQTLAYDKNWGVANSGVSVMQKNRLYLIVGHANGFLTIWESKTDKLHFTFCTQVDVQSATPVNPWNMHNIRGLALIRKDNEFSWVVSGSEDGDLCVIRIPDGKIISRTVYNPAAKRGINSIAAAGSNLLVANCAVGKDDKNLWLYSIDYADGSVNLLDSKNLQMNVEMQQVFNFDVIWGNYAEGMCWFSATEEGLLWMGKISNNNTISIIGNQRVGGQLGAAIGMTITGNLAHAAYDLYEFNTKQNRIQTTDEHPERLMID